jgi:hypothetical protein
MVVPRGVGLTGSRAGEIAIRFGQPGFVLPVCKGPEPLVPLPDGTTVVGWLVGLPTPRVDPPDEYVRAEHDRASALLALLRDGGDPVAAGRLMYDSHHDGGRVGMGDPSSDNLVEAVEGLGPSYGCYGARSSGGTIVVFCSLDALPKLRRQTRLID